MSQRIEFTVPVLPCAQPRQRHRIVQRAGQTFATNYTPSKSPVSDYKATVRLAAAQAYSGPPLKGPLCVVLACVFPAKRKARVPKDTRPDCDNLAKSTLDCLNGLLFKDDGQVVDLRVTKWHANADEQPHVSVCIEPFSASA